MKQTSMPEGSSLIVSLRERTIQISLFLIREIIEVVTSRSAIQSYWIYKHDPLLSCLVLRNNLQASDWSIIANEGGAMLA